MKKILLLMMAMTLVAVSSWAGGYQFISASDLKQKLETQEEVFVLDIQVEPEFAQHHIAGAVATYAYPVKSDADRAKLDAVLAQVKAGQEPVAIVCPRGGGGAKRAYAYLQDQGVAEERLLILEGGQAKWPYAELLAKK